MIFRPLILGCFLLCFTRTQAQLEPDVYKQLDTLDRAAPGAPVFKSKEATEQAIERCSAENVRTEFDSDDSLLSRVVKAPCKFVGVTTYRGRGDSLLGDVLKYDPDHEAVFWDIAIHDNVRYGRIALPFALVDTQGHRKDLNKAQESSFKAMTSTSFFLLPLYGEKDETSTYEAANAFGARTHVLSLKGERYSLAINSGSNFMAGQNFRVFAISLPRANAPDLVPNLDVQVYWLASQPCETCLGGGRLTETSGGPTFNNPQDVQLAHKYVLGRFAAIRLVDRRDGRTYAIYSGGQTYPGR